MTLPPGARPRASVVTSSWDAVAEDEEPFAVRRIAGALACAADVEVVLADGAGEGTSCDGVFDVMRLAGSRPPRWLRHALLSAALDEAARRLDTSAPVVSSFAAAKLGALASAEIPGLAAHLTARAPRAVVIAGAHHRTLLAQLAEPGTAAPGTVRALLPLAFGSTASAATGAPREDAPWAASVDVVLTTSPAEHAWAERLTHAPGPKPALARVGIPLAVPEEAAGRPPIALPDSDYVVAMLGPRRAPVPGHTAGLLVAHLAAALGDIPVIVLAGTRAEVRKGRKFWTGPIARTRMDRLRIVAHARASVDLVDPSPLGRATLESLLTGTPACAPAGTVAAAHLAESNGGLWFEDAEEMVACVRALLDRETGAALGDQGRRWARETCGDRDAFVDRVCEAVLGFAPGAAAGSAAGTAPGTTPGSAATAPVRPAATPIATAPSRT